MGVIERVREIGAKRAALIVDFGPIRANTDRDAYSAMLRAPLPSLPHGTRLARSWRPLERQPPPGTCQST